MSHTQAGQVTRAVGTMSSTAQLRNVLVHDATNGFYPSAGGSSVEHGTVHRVSKLANSTNTPVCLTNTLLIAVTNNYAHSGQNVGISASDSGIFQAVGAGSHYLATGSAYRDAGTTAIDAELLDQLQSRTTFPPAVLGGVVAGDLALGRQTPREDGQPDLGFYYDPLDWLAQSVTITNCAVVVTNAATVGVDLNGTDYGVKLSHRPVLASGGFAHDLNRFVRVHAVQEGAASSGAFYPMFCDVDSSPNPPRASFHFTDFPLLAASFLWNEDDGFATTTPWTHRHCQFHGGYLWASQGITNATATFTNNLFERFVFLLGPTVPTANRFMNNLFWNGNLTVSEGDFKDKLFVNTDLIGTVTNDYNAYVTNANRLSPNGPNDKILTNTPSFLSGPLGGYYYPTNDGMLSTLIFKGGRYSTNAGLSHFTVKLDQAKNGTNLVSIGFNFVATTNGLPIDTDGDGLGDYWEDWSGDGVASSGETDWQNASDPGLGVRILRPRSGSILP